MRTLADHYSFLAEEQRRCGVYPELSPLMTFMFYAGAAALFDVMMKAVESESTDAIRTALESTRGEIAEHCEGLPK